MPDAYAHRGLWSHEGPPENSMASFEAAATAGVGVELDIQLSKDGVPVVFHDPMLDRMTDASGPVWEKTAEELDALRLTGADEPIPRLSDVAMMLPAGMPVLVELKPTPGDPEEYLRAVDLALFGVAIDASIMSFTAGVNKAARVVMPQRRRGLLVPPLSPAIARGPADVVDTAASLDIDYLAVPFGMITAFAGEPECRYPLYAWTVDTDHALATVADAAAAVIFEHLDPALVSR
ncbi:MAG: glycerophosphodiester phosphodiesterase family protein [Pseudomonadota bacterium]